MMHNWKDILVNEDEDLSSAIHILNKGGVRIVVVVNDTGHLLGTITDGDVRRALLRNFDLTTSVTKVMNKNPVTMDRSEDNDHFFTLMKMKDLVAIPVINENGKVVDVKILSHLLSGVKHENPVFLLAGGFGKRLSPLTDHTPKPLLQIGQKPILETILLQFIDGGFHNFYISTHYKADLVMKHFGNGDKWGVKIQYVHEEEPLGTAGSLSLLSGLIGKCHLPVIIMNGDILTKVNFSDIINFHNSHDGKATVCSCEYTFQLPYANLHVDNGLLVDIKEKPNKNFIINAGIYVLEPDLLDYIKHNSYLDMPNLIESRIKSGDKVNVFPLHEYWIDIGDMETYRDAYLAYSEEFQI
jgi:dTDP-glucose pyrophosphorylase